MSVGVTEPVVPRMWRGYDDPGLPVGNWIATGFVVGNGTGGVMTVDLLFKPEDQPSSGRFYNLEQFDIFRTNTITASGFLVLDNFEQLGSLTITTRQWRFELQDNGNGVGAIHYQEGFPKLPLFLGQSSRVASLNSVMQVGVINVNIVVLTVVAQGYIWEPRSIMAPGGLRRPLDSLYGR